MSNVETRLTGMEAQLTSFAGAMQRVESKQDKIIGIVGEEREDGKGGVIGVGLMGRMRRNETGLEKVTLTLRLWIAFGGGVVFTIGFTGAMIWWLVGDKLGTILQ